MPEDSCVAMFPEANRGISPRFDDLVRIMDGLIFFFQPGEIPTPLGRAGLQQQNQVQSAYCTLQRQPPTTNQGRAYYVE
jgi:hypothetical protein